MSTKVVMPQMGESITEGTIVRWFKRVGEPIAKDEPLLEISTDKVDAEVPSPASGTLAKILHEPGETVAVETLIAEIAGDGESAEAAAVPAEPTVQETPSTAPAPRPAPAPAPSPAASEEPVSTAKPSAREVVKPQTDDRPGSVAEGEEERLRRRSSPLVRRIAAEHDVDLGDVPGTGIQGRVTKGDIMAFVERRGRGGAAAPPPARPSVVPPASGTATTLPLGGATLAPTGPFAGDERREPMSIMRQRIAEHMVLSRHTSPHVNTVFEADLSRVVALRARHGDTFAAQYGLKLTFTPFFVEAAVEALKAFPVVNASLDGSDVVYHRHINIGVAVALSHGLIVPVIKHAEELSLEGIQAAVTDLATRARTKQLKPDDVQGSTFSITNPGPYGGLYGLPIINQPNVAILSTGGIKRRPIVVTDEEGRESLAIRDMIYLALSFDHRLVDGATADQFMARLVAVLEAAEFDLR
jgi:pyruvate dehydrogenase E2 component (dihydrolipoyllysine-residue acetyltransferase)